MKIKTIFIGRRPARATPRNQGGGRAKRVRCQELIESGAKKMMRALKFGGLIELTGFIVAGPGHHTGRPVTFAPIAYAFHSDQTNAGLPGTRPTANI